VRELNSFETHEYQGFIGYESITWPNILYFVRM